MNNIKKAVIFGATVPFFAFAMDFKGLVTQIMGQIDILPAFIIGLAVLYFLWNVAQYIMAGGDPKKAEEAGKMITYSLIAMFVMISVYALIGVIQSTLNLGANDVVDVPALPSSGGSSSWDSWGW